jgi:hypothetical protein
MQQLAVVFSFIVNGTTLTTRISQMPTLRQAGRQACAGAYSSGLPPLVCRIDGRDHKWHDKTHSRLYNTAQRSTLD